MVDGRGPGNVMLDGRGAAQTQQEIGAVLCISVAHTISEVRLSVQQRLNVRQLTRIKHFQKRAQLEGKIDFIQEKLNHQVLLGVLSDNPQRTC